MSDKLQKTAARMKILFVRLHMLSQVIDSPRQQRNLNLR